MRGIKFRIDASCGETNEKDKGGETSLGGSPRCTPGIREIIKKLVVDFAPHSGALVAGGEVRKMHGGLIIVGHPRC